MKVQGEFKVNKWDETNLSTFPTETPIAKASIIYEVSGEIHGELVVESLLHYSYQDKEDPLNSEATYIGYMFFVGTVNGKSGSLVVEDNGKYTKMGPVSTLTIKPNTGTGELCDILGVGSYAFKNGKMMIEFSLE